MKFKVGEICESLFQDGNWYDAEIISVDGGGWYTIKAPQFNIFYSTGYWDQREHNLRKKKPPQYDGYDIVKWDDCLWKPKEVTV